MTRAEIRTQLDLIQAHDREVLRAKLSIDSHSFTARFDPLDPPAADPNGLRASTLASLLDRLPSIVERCADDLLHTYNSAWADDDPNEGTPPLERRAFVASFHLSAVTIFHDLSASVAFDVGDLFAGHLVQLSLDAALEVQGRASLWG